MHENVQLAGISISDAALSVVNTFMGLPPFLPWPIFKDTATMACSICSICAIVSIGTLAEICMLGTTRSMQMTMTYAYNCREVLERTYRFVLALRYCYGNAFISLTPRRACSASDKLACLSGWLLAAKS